MSHHSSNAERGDMPLRHATSHGYSMHTCSNSSSEPKKALNSSYQRVMSVAMLLPLPVLDDAHHAQHLLDLLLGETGRDARHVSLLALAPHQHVQQHARRRGASTQDVVLGQKPELVGDVLGVWYLVERRRAAAERELMVVIMFGHGALSCAPLGWA